MQRPSSSIARTTLSTPVFLLLILGGLAVIAGFVGSKPFNQTVIDIFVRVVLVVGIYIFIGNSGVLSFGHISFACLGAYGAAWLTMPPMMKQMSFPGLLEPIQQMQFSYWIGALGAMAFAGIVALVFGAMLMRLSGISASIATFAMLAMINTIWSNWESVTAATNSVVGIPIVRVVWPYLIAAALAVLIAWGYSISRFGLALRAARDEPVAAAASGVDIPAMRRIAFTLSGAVVGLGGAMFAHSIGVVTPDTFYMGLTFTTMSMLVVGGMGTLTGAVIGTVGLSLLIQMLRSLEKGVDIGVISLKIPGGLQEIMLGLIMITILACRPEGLFPRELRLSFRRKTSDQTAAGPSTQIANKEQIS
jgi:branched-chain amino acid transport system permease protein